MTALHRIHNRSARRPAARLILIALALGLAAALPAAAQPTQTWAHQFPIHLISYDDANDLAINGEGNVVLAGRWWDTWGLLCLDSSTGAALWELQGTVEESQFNSVVALDDGTGDVIAGGLEGMDGLLMRVSPAGEVIWTQTFDKPGPPNNADLITAMTPVPDGRVFAAGVYTSVKRYGWFMADDPSQHHLYANVPTGFPRGYAMATATPSVILVGGRRFDGSTFSGAIARVNIDTGAQWVYQAWEIGAVEGLTPTPDGRCIYVGIFPGDFNGPAHAAVGALNAQGESLWLLEHGVGGEHSSYDDVCLVDPAGSSDVYVVGQMNQPPDNTHLPVLRRMTSDGDTLWSVYGTLGSHSSNRWGAVAALPGGGVVVAGKTVAFNWPNEDEHIVIERYDP